LDETRELVDLFVDTWKMFAHRMPTGTVEERDGVVAALGNVPLPFLNACLQSEPVEDIESFRAWLATAKSMASKDHDTIFPICEAWLPEGWEAELEGAGMMIGIESTGMATNELVPPKRPLPELDIRKVEDVEAATHVAALNAAAYDMPPELFDSVCNMNLWGEGTYGYVGYLADGTPVASSGTYPVNGTVYVALVATHPDHQRKGYAEAVMRRSVEEGMAGTGLTRTTLHSTEAGLSVYEAMGYRGGPRFPMLMLEH